MYRNLSFKCINNLLIYMSLVPIAFKHDISIISLNHRTFKNVIVILALQKGESTVNT